MAKLLTLGVGFSDAPDKVQPTLNDCLVAVIEHAELIMEEVVDGLMLARQPTGPRRNPTLQEPAIRRAIDHLQRQSDEVCADFRGEFSRIVYEGGAAASATASVLRFEDLKLLDGPDLERNIEVARATQELLLTVEDVLPPLDAYVSTLLGWRTIQPELNPLRPDVFVRALQAVLSWHVPDDKVREALITPSAGLVGVNLRKIYRELSDWLRLCQVEPAVPTGGIVTRRGFFNAMPAQESVARTLLTLDRLRLLMTGGFEQPEAGEGPSDFLHTVPASMAMLQELKQVDSFVSRLAQRARPRTGEGAAEARDPAAQARLGRRLGEEVVRQMFDNLAQDVRLLPGYLARLRKIEPAVIKLARNDSRFFSDPQHPARRLLDQLTERSLGFKADTDEGCARFLASTETAVRWLETDTVDADVFRELLEYLEAEWARQDRQLHERRERETQVLLQDEQRQLLVDRYAAEFASACKRRPVPDFVADLLIKTWPRVVAEARLTCTDGSEDPGGYRELARELIWSVQSKKNPTPARTRRLAVMIPGLLTQLRSGLASIDYPQARTDLLFDKLITVHQAALQEGRDASPQATAALTGDDNVVDAAVQWLSENDSVDPRDAAESAADDTVLDEEAGPQPAGLGPVELRPGAWVDLMVDGQWLRVQLTWASPGATLFMFISPAGTAHSMSRRTLERLRQQGLMRVVADRSLVQEALDGVATAALANTFAPRR